MDHPSARTDFLRGDVVIKGRDHRTDEDRPSGRGVRHETVRIHDAYKRAGATFANLHVMMGESRTASGSRSSPSTAPGGPQPRAPELRPDGGRSRSTADGCVHAPHEAWPRRRDRTGSSSTPRRWARSPRRRAPSGGAGTPSGPGSGLGSPMASVATPPSKGALAGDLASRARPARRSIAGVPEASRHRGVARTQPCAVRASRPCPAMNCCERTLERARRRRFGASGDGEGRRRRDANSRTISRPASDARG